MQELKLLLEHEGYEGVQTYIQSGNVVLNANSKPLKNIVEKVKTKFGFSPEILILKKSEFEHAVSSNPFTSFEGKTVHFYFCSKKPVLNNLKLESLSANGEQYELNGNVFYLHAPNGIGRSKLVSNIEACLGVPATGRNRNTVLKIQEMVKNV